jgi:NADP-reducing hydrogenase subunit HndB
MSAIQSLEDLNRFREEVLEKKARAASLGAVQVVVGMGTCGIAAGALNTMQAILEQVEAEHLQNILVSKTGCIGLCEEEPVVQVALGQKRMVTYGKVTPEKARRILKEHVLGGSPVLDYIVKA